MDRLIFLASINIVYITTAPREQVTVIIQTHLSRVNYDFRKIIGRHLWFDSQWIVFQPGTIDTCQVDIGPLENS